MNRTEILEEAKKCITGNRVDDYGTPENNFSVIASLWTEYLGIKVSSIDVAMLMIMLKVARVRNGGGSGDSFVDIAGYAACAGEISNCLNTEYSVS